MKADKTTPKKFYTEQIAFYIVPETRDVFITAINMSTAHLTGQYCILHCTYFSADPSDRAG